MKTVVNNSDIMVVSGFYTGVSQDRYRILDLHQNYLLVSGSQDIYIYCTGLPLADNYKHDQIKYIDSGIVDSEPVLTIERMTKKAAEIAREIKKRWVVITFADIWGPHKDWSFNLVQTGLQANPHAEFVTFNYRNTGYLARLLAVTPDCIDALFDKNHCARFRGILNQNKHDKYNYERYLMERVQQLGLSKKVGLLDSKVVNKKQIEKQGERKRYRVVSTVNGRKTIEIKKKKLHRTVVPADDILYHEHSHVYASIKHRWYYHRVD